LFQEQKAWLEEVLSNNPRKWTIITFHHPIYSASERRDNAELRDVWKPVFDKYGVDLVLQGHDHTYARGRAEPYGVNIVDGLNTRDYTGTVYVVSVSGGKMYRLKQTGWDYFEEVDRDRSAENTQLFQVIDIDGEKLSYKSYTATGELYDAFELRKSPDGKPNQFTERRNEAIPERHHGNTIHYDDILPEPVKLKVLTENEGFHLQRVNYFEEPEQNGYYLRLYKENTRLELKIDTAGNVLERNIQEY
jgi:3',5'-cyclic AMP phosphodiesterase CpdA